ncbi:MAG: hypothetical protein QCI82_04520, partial [Candidatus Thermoplasmatota archaeon]|nr:hypothetical protein [Candidatus Thermoplasmatota archaeon]
HNCNIEDATFINSTIFNCWIGNNVTFNNCPPGSDPAAGMELSEYFSNNLNNKYDNMKQNWTPMITYARTIMMDMDNDILGNIDPVESLLRESVREISNNTILDIYPIFDVNSSYNNCYENIISDCEINLIGNYTKGNETITINVTLYMKFHDDFNISHYDYYGNIDYRDNQNNSRSWNNQIDINYTNKNRKSNDISRLNDYLYDVAGDNSTYTIEKMFLYNNVSVGFNYYYDNTSKDFGIIIISNEQQGITFMSNDLFNTTLHYGVTKYKDPSTGYSAKINAKSIKKFDRSINNYTLFEDSSISDGLGVSYAWNDFSTTTETTTRFILLENGTLVDPTYKYNDDKVKYRQKILGKNRVIGSNFSYYYKLFERDIMIITAALAVITFIGAQALALAGTIIGAIIGAAIGGVWGAVAGAIVGFIIGFIGSLGAITITTAWSIFLIMAFDTTNDDIEMKITFDGKYYRSGTITARYYRWNLGNNCYKLYVRNIGPARFIGYETLLT